MARSLVLALAFTAAAGSRADDGRLEILGPLFPVIPGVTTVSHTATATPSFGPGFTPVGPKINSTGDLVGLGYNVNVDPTNPDNQTVHAGVFTSSWGRLVQRDTASPFFGGAAVITDDGAIWGRFDTACPRSLGITRLSRTGQCTLLPSSDYDASQGILFGTNFTGASNSGRFVIGQPTPDFGAAPGPIVIWSRGADGRYTFHNLGFPQGVVADPNAAFVTVSVTRPNDQGEYGVNIGSCQWGGGWGGFNSGQCDFQAYLYRFDPSDPSSTTKPVAALGDHTWVAAINNAGEMAGALYSVQGWATVPTTPFIYRSGKVETFDPSQQISGWQSQQPVLVVGINDLGDVVFSGQEAVNGNFSGQRALVRKADGRIIDVGGRYPFLYSTDFIPTGINNSGVVVGDWSNGYPAPPMPLLTFPWKFESGDESGDD
jgi:hypothetical protein